MSRALIIVKGNADRQRVLALAAKVPTGTRVEFKAAKRTLPQNDRMWAMLSDIARQVEWHGNRLRADEWKTIFMAALKRELRLVPGIDGGMVNLSNSTRDLSKGEMSDLMELIAAFGAERGVAFGDSEAA